MPVESMGESNILMNGWYIVNGSREALNKLHVQNFKLYIAIEVAMIWKTSQADV